MQTYLVVDVWFNQIVSDRRLNGLEVPLSLQCNEFIMTLSVCHTLLAECHVTVLEMEHEKEIARTNYETTRLKVELNGQR